jgi:hypothetical protein
MKRIYYYYYHHHHHHHYYYYYYYYYCRDSSVGIALGYGLGDRFLGFDSRREQGILLFTTASRTALRPTQPPI